MLETNKNNGTFIGFGIRELNQQELNLFCPKTNQIINDLSNLIKKLSNKPTYTSDFLLIAYSSGCYYYDIINGKWKTNGLEILEDTNLEYTHCIAYHLTEFAGGLNNFNDININYIYVLNNSSFTQNLTIYITLILILIIYIICAILARIYDKKDKNKIGLYSLNDNNENQRYFYELIIYTGNRSESATNSKVFIKF
jgi:hypothetical protein